MTRELRLAELQALVDLWLPRLGQAHWTVVVTDKGTLDHDDALLEVARHETAHRAVIKAADWYLDGVDEPGGLEAIDGAFVEQAVVHELCHLLFRDVRWLVREVTADELAGAAKSTLDLALDRHEEATVDLLARGLVSSWPA